MSRGNWLKTLALALALGGFMGTGTAKAQDWNDYLHWPYNPPQNPGAGFEYNSLYDGQYLYPKEQRIAPPVPGPYYRNYYHGWLINGMRHPHGWHGWNKKKWYQGYHFYLDVF